MLVSISTVWVIFSMINCAVLLCGGKSTQILYSSKSTNTAIYKYCVTSKSPEFKIYLSKSTKTLAPSMLWLMLDSSPGKPGESGCPGRAR